MKAPMSLGWTSDPAHGWLLVTEEQMKDSGIKTATFSPYSYYSAEFRTYALEEDCDARLFLNALAKQGIEHMVWDEHMTECDSFVRSWDRIEQEITV